MRLRQGMGLLDWLSRITAGVTWHITGYPTLWAHMGCTCWHVLVPLVASRGLHMLVVLALAAGLLSLSSQEGMPIAP